MGPTREELTAFIKGHRAAFEYIEDERLERLTHLSPAQAREAYDELCDFLARAIDPRERLALDQLQLEHLLHRRRILDRLATRPRRS